MSLWSRLSPWLLIVLLAGVEVVLLVGAVLLWAAADQAAVTFPELSWMKWPVLALCWGVVGCGMVFVGVTMALAVMVRRQRIFGRRALALVRVMSVAALLAAVLLGAVMVIVPGSPMNLVMVVCVLLFLTLAVLMEVMRGLLGLAVGFRSELDEVI